MPAPPLAPEGLVTPPNRPVTAPNGLLPDAPVALDSPPSKPVSAPSGLLPLAVVGVTVVFPTLASTLPSAFGCVALVLPESRPPALVTVLPSAMSGLPRLATAAFGAAALTCAPVEFNAPPSVPSRPAAGVPRPVVLPSVCVVVVSVLVIGVMADERAVVA